MKKIDTIVELDIIAQDLIEELYNAGMEETADYFQRRLEDIEKNIK